MKRLILAAMLATGLAGAAHADDALKSAIAGDQRAAANKARDTYRHPYETLTFFGIKPTMTVIELAPGGGWYTEILAPYLRDKGKLIGGAPSAESRARRLMPACLPSTVGMPATVPSAWVTPSPAGRGAPEGLRSQVTGPSFPVTMGRMGVSERPTRAAYPLCRFETVILASTTMSNGMLAPLAPSESVTSST